MQVTSLKQELIVFKKPPSLADVEQARKICLRAKLEGGILSNPYFLQTLADICSWWAIGNILLGTTQSSGGSRGSREGGK